MKYSILILLFLLLVGCESKPPPPPHVNVFTADENQMLEALPLQKKVFIQGCFNNERRYERSGMHDKDSTLFHKCHIRLLDTFNNRAVVKGGGTGLGTAVMGSVIGNALTK